VELVPFQAAVDAGVDAVMTAHVAMPVLLGEGALPATLEPRLMTRLLREEMGFQGLLFTDALRMGAITAAYGAGEAAVMALEAGSDVLLAPDDIPGAIDAVVAAVETGRLDRQRLKASARKVLTLKAGAGLHRRRTVDLDRVSTRVGTGDHLALADEMAERSITLPRDDGGHVPLDLERAQRVLSVTWARPDDLLASATFDPMLARFVDRVARVRLRPDTDPATYRALSRTAAEYDAVVVSAYVPPRSGAGAVAIPDDFTNFVGRVADTTPTVLISFGSPYVLTAFPELGSYMIAWGDREVSQRAAARALVGASGVGGRLPVSIPPYHVLGDGLDRTARDVQPRPAGDPLVEAGMVAAPAGGAEEGGELRCVSWTGSPVTPDTDPSSCPRASLVFESGREAPASEVGMDEEALSAVDNLILRGITQGATPGAVLAVGRHGRFARLRGYGRVAWDEGAAPTNHRSVYDLASLTKVVATTTAMMILVDEGRIDLDERVVTVLPWWDAGYPAKARVTVRQLLLHRAGLPPFRRYYLDIEGIDSYKEAIAREPLIYEPGDSTVYSDIGLMTAGFIIEEVTGQGLDEFVEERVWGPLGMDDTGFTPERSMLPRIPPTEVDATYRQIHVHGVVHDENAYAMGGVAGHAGLFSSAADLAVFAQTLLNGGLPASCPSEGSRSRVCASGASGGQRLIREATVTGFTTRRDDSSGRAHGWDTPWGPSSAGDYFTERSFGHTGYTGTSLWIDPVRDVFVVLLTTRVNPTRANTLHVALRRAVHDGIARAITDMPVERR
jgi:CubicO group peptidase (beta-lactamase class C family)